MHPRRSHFARLARLAPGASRAFSLLEVMVAVAILGLTLTVILSAQGGLAASNKSAANMGLATTAGRCKMTELEEKLLKMGYPLVDDLQSDVACCEDQNDSAFRCDTRVEKVELPKPPDNSLGDGGSSLSLGSLAGSASAGSGGAGGLPGPLGSISSMINPGGGAGLNLDGGGLQNLGASLTQQMSPGGQGTQGLLQMVMGLVYPQMKLMFEASIRRLTVTVRWKEGPNRKEMGLVQYVTNPQQAGFVAGVVPSASASAGAGGTTTTVPTPGLGGPLGNPLGRQQ